MSFNAGNTRFLPHWFRSFVLLPWRVGGRRLPTSVRRPPLLAHLVVFALIILVPALFFSAFLILQFSEQQKEIARAQVNDTAEIISNAVDREIYGMVTTGRVLASSPSLLSGNLADFHDRTVAALQLTDTDAALVDPRLDVVLSTLRPYPSPPIHASYTLSIEKAFETGEPQVSGVFYGKTSQRFLFHIAMPVARDGKVAYVLIISKATQNLGKVIRDRNLPRDWSAVITDASGHEVFAAVSSDGKMKADKRSPEIDPPASHRGDPSFGGDALEASTTSYLSGWTTTLFVPNAVIVRPVLRSWLLLITAGTVLLLFSVLLGMVYGRRIANPISKLSRQAVAIGKGEPAVTISTDIAEIAEVSRVLAQASRERREAEEQNQFLMREMTHRAKNQYALIAAIARRAARESADTTELLATLSEALNSLARSADLLAGRGWESVELERLVGTQLQAFGIDGDQITLQGPAVMLNPSAAQTLGLAMHELATNAAKYGALSNDTGIVAISWTIDKTFEIVWRESGGPTVVPPRHSGFGTLVTQKMTSRGLGGAVEMDYAATGVVWKLRAPADMVLVVDRRVGKA